MRIPLCVAATLFATGLAAAQSNDPRPQDATRAILAAFDRYDVVGLTAAHSNKLQDDFILSLIRDPRLAGKVNDIAVECGNSRYQAVLDRYIEGEDVPIEEARQVWRNTVVAMCSVSGFYNELFPLVREINKGLPAGKRFRVLALEPAVDWSAGDSSTVLRSAGDRNASIVSVMTTEVFAKRRKALVLCGVGHLFHHEPSRDTAVSIYERSYSGRTFVIMDHAGFAAFIDLDRGRELEARMQSWPRPSIVPIKGTWLADLDLPYYMWPFPRRMAGEMIADKVDAYLYLGPGNSLTYEKTPSAILDDEAYMAQVSRRFAIDVDVLRRRNDNTALFTAADRQEARQFAPGAEFVGAYSRAPGGEPVAEVDFRGGKLSARLPPAPGWVTLASAGTPTRYRVDISAQDVFVEFEVVNGTVTGVVLDPGSAQPRLKLQRLQSVVGASR
jgi:hypothetical protein